MMKSGKEIIIPADKAANVAREVGLQELLVSSSHPGDEMTDTPLPESIGGYAIRRILATGGMGVVYEAVQSSPKRSVAIKVMRAGLASRSALRRFEIEADLLAHLDHHGIAQVFDAGTHDDGAGGVPFFVMEYIVDARSIVQFVRDEQLDLRRRLHLFALACDAVQYGHLKGVIHRDLKPDNILVGNNADSQDGFQLKVIDFGVARFTDADITIATLQTDVGQLIGTLQYMSPEQCDGKPGQLDTRTDVYSLGVILYELLCDRLPYDLSDTSIPGATRIIQEHEPPRPSSIVRTLRGDLEAIVLKAIEKDREDRYQSAADLATDIRRYLNKEPIEARQPGRWLRATRWIGRHPVVTTTVACVLIGGISVALTLGAIWWLQRKPHDVVVSSDGRYAHLLSVAGAILHTWDSGAPDGVSEASVIETDVDGRVTKLIAVGFTSWATNRWSGQLCLFDLEGGSWQEPKHVLKVLGDEIPADLDPERYRARGFWLSWFQTADFFPEHEGDELLVQFAHDPLSPRSLRIYDPNDGKILFEVWHDGAFSKAYWESDRGVMVLAGVNNRTPWWQLGEAQTKGGYPLFIAAIGPQIGFRSTTWLDYMQVHPKSPLLWYKVLWPSSSADIFKMLRAQTAYTTDDPEALARVEATLPDDDKASINWLIDVDGEIIPGAEVVSENFRFKVRDREIKLDEFRFVPFGGAMPGDR